MKADLSLLFNIYARLLELELSRLVKQQLPLTREPRQHFRVAVCGAPIGPLRLQHEFKRPINHARQQLLQHGVV